jgi:hypothetical protein
MWLGGATASRKAGALAKLSPASQGSFDIKAIKALSSGFELTFTQPVDAGFAAKPGSYEISQFTYAHQIDPAPELDHSGAAGKATALKVIAAKAAPDGLSVQLQVAGLRAGFVTSVRAAGLLSTDGQPLRQGTLWYALNQLPK